MPDDQSPVNLGDAFFSALSVGNKDLLERIRPSTTDAECYSIAIEMFSRWESGRASALASRPVTKSGFVYVIRGVTSGLFKIGYSNSPKKRLSMLACGSSEALEFIYTKECEDARLTEARIHEAFSEARVRGEWFKLDEQALSRLKQLIG